MSFETYADGFAFTTLSSRGMAPKAAALRVRLVAGSSLLMKIYTLDDDGAEDLLLEQILTKSTPQIEFSYLDAATEPAEWRKEWQDRADLPSLIKITVVSETSSDWPDFIVHPALGLQRP